MARRGRNSRKKQKQQKTSTSSPTTGQTSESQQKTEKVLPLADIQRLLIEENKEDLGQLEKLLDNIIEILDKFKPAWKILCASQGINIGNNNEIIYMEGQNGDVPGSSSQEPDREQNILRDKVIFMCNAKELRERIRIWKQEKEKKKALLLETGAGPTPSLNPLDEHPNVGSAKAASGDKVEVDVPSLVLERPESPDVYYDAVEYLEDPLPLPVIRRPRRNRWDRRVRRRVVVTASPERHVDVYPPEYPLGLPVLPEGRLETCQCRPGCTKVLSAVSYRLLRGAELRRFFPTAEDLLGAPVSYG